MNLPRAAFGGVFVIAGMTAGLARNPGAPAVVVVVIGCLIMLTALRRPS